MAIRLALHGQAVEGKYKTMAELLKAKGYKDHEDLKDAGYSWWEDGRDNSVDTRQQRANAFREKTNSAKKEHIQCVVCDRWYTGDPNEPHMCEECSDDSRFEKNKK